MKRSQWPDFFFTIVVRFIGGVILGCAACLLFGYRSLLRAFSQDKTRGPLIWPAGCGLAGGVIAVFATPGWQTPWYKGIHGRDDNDL